MAATLAALLLGGGAVAPVEAAVGVKAASPRGEVALVRQVRVTFGEPMGKFGDPRLAAPMAVACNPAATAEGSSRWIDDKTWVFDFKQDLPPGTRCEVKPAAGATSLAGQALAADSGFRFSTGGPAIVRASPEPGDHAGIDEAQAFALLLNGPATAASVERFAWCEFAGVGERVPVSIIDGPPRAAILEATGLVPRQARVLVLRCARPAAPDTRVSLVWGAGIATASGVASSAPRRLEYTVRPAFTASFSCTRTSPRADCLSLRPLRVEFSSPVPRALARQVVLAGPDGRHSPRFGPAGGTPGADAGEGSVEAVEFAGPLPEKAAFRIELPAGFVDDAGRRLENASEFPLAVRTAEAPPLAKFPAATFGVLELDAEPVLPLTVRHVEGRLAIKAMTLAGAPARDLTLTDDAGIIAWFARLARYDEATLDRSAVEKELGIRLPPAVRPTAPPASSRASAAAARDLPDDAPPFDPNVIRTREVSLLNRAAGVRQVALPAEAQADPHPFEVIGIPLPQPGYHVVEIESPRLGQALLDRAAPMYVRTGVLVTNLSVHFKWAPVNAGAWVTTLDDGKPVAGAAVQVSDCRGHAVWRGVTDAHGFALIEKPLPRMQWDACDSDGGSPAAGPSGRPNGYFVSARKTDAKGRADLAFVWSTWQDGIEAWRFNLDAYGGGGEGASDLYHTVMDRTLLRAGQTVSMKSHARRERLTGLGLVAAADLPGILRIEHVGSGDKIDLPITWRNGRYAETAYAIPPDAKLGVYEVSLLRGEERRYASGSFRVEEFRVPAMSGRLVPPAGPQVDPRDVSLAVMVNYANGGGAGGLPLQVSAQTRDLDLARALPLSRYPGFRFDAPRGTDPGNLADAPANAVAEDEAEDADATTQRDPDARLVADKIAVTLDKAGAGRVTLPRLPAVKTAKELLVQANYADANGEVQTLSQTVPLWPSAVVLGVRTDDWVSVRQNLPAQVIALDTAGKPRAGVEVSVHGVVHRSLTARKRLVGGFYAYDNKSVDEDLGEVCKGTSDARGLVFCEARLEASGEVELVAQARDAQGHVAHAAATVWVTRAGEVWFGSANDDRMDVLPEQRVYEPGQKARFQVRSPFRHATALVAIERDGILETMEMALDGRDPTIEIPVKADWGPNVFVSVLAVRGRVRDVPWYSLFTWGWRSPVQWWRAWRDEGHEYEPPTAMVDLARPAFRYGIAEIQVGTGAHRLKVDVVPDKASYPIRATSQVRVRVSLPDGKPVPAGTEVTLAAVDEALLTLKPNESWNLFDAMIRRRDYGVETATAQMQIIGKRHFGKKAAPPGGGGGQFPTRELFDTLLAWRPVVVLDARGEATVPVPLNDSLTSFRIAVVADLVRGDDASLFGEGQATIAATQDLQIVSGVPPLVREGDRYKAMFTLRNTTKKPVEVSVAASAGAAALPTLKLTIAAGGATETGWDVEAPRGSPSIDWSVTASGGGAQDRLKFAQRVDAAVPVTVQQATLMQLDKPLEIPVAPPLNALADAGRLRGGLEVSLRPSLADGLPGVRGYFLDMPWTCLEQLASTAIGLRDAQRWRDLMGRLPLYLDADGLAHYFPSAGTGLHDGSDTLTAYLLSVSDEATRVGGEFKIPEELRNTLERGLIGFVEGRVDRQSWRPAGARGDLDLRKLAALEALSRRGKVQPRMLDSIQVLPNQWPTSAVIDWLQILGRTPAIADRPRRLAEAEQILRARLNMQGTRMGFSTERDDNSGWLMTNADVNSVRLLLAVMAMPGWQDDMPRLVAGTLQRQQFGHWSTTVANAWGSVAMAAFSRRFESVPVTGTTRARLDGGPAAASLDWSRQAAGGTLALGWPSAFATKGNTAATVLGVAQEGTGKPWVTLVARAAVPLTAPFGSGYRVVKTLAPVSRKTPGQWSRGDVVRVHLDIDVQADATWVVVDDPVPGGASLLGKGLGNDDAIAVSGEKADSRAWLAYEERGQAAFRAYYGFLPKGRFGIDYTVRLNNPGEFGLPPTRVQAMYAPEMFGEAPNPGWRVQP